MSKNSSYNFTPGETIVYSRPSNSPFWERRRKRAYSSLTTSVQLAAPSVKSLSKIETTVNMLHSIASAERTKEDTFIKSLPAFKGLEYNDFIKDFNAILQGKERFEALQNRIKDALTRSKKDNSNFKGMAPNMSSVYASYLATELERSISNLVQRIDINKPTELWAEDFNNAIQEAINNAVIMAGQSSEYEKIFGVLTETKSIYGGYTDWSSDLVSILTDMRVPQARDFSNMIFTKLGEENLKALQKDIQDASKSIKNSIQKETKIKSRIASIGGNVVEYVMAIIIQSVQGGNVYGNAFTAEGFKTDSAVIASMNAEIQTNTLSETLFNQLKRDVFNSEANLENVSKQFDKFYNENLSKLDDTFIMFVNAKNYGIGRGSNTWIDNERNGSLEELPEFLSSTNTNILGNPDEFLELAYNTAAGAICNGSRVEVETAAVNALKVAAAKLMFDDFSQIGSDMDQSGAKLLHVYQFDSVFIPSSFMFQALGDALEQSVELSFSKIEAMVTLPGPVLDDYPKSGPDPAVKEEIIAASHKEWERAVNTSSWTVNFSINIRQTIANALGFQF